LSNVIQFPTDRVASRLWSPRNGINPNWRMSTRPAVLQFLRECNGKDGYIPRLSNMEDLLEMMAEEYRHEYISFVDLYYKYFPQGSGGGRSTFAHQLYVQDKIEQICLTRTV